jgi:hypothetical protein
MENFNFSSRLCTDVNLRLAHDRFLPNPFQFFIHHHPSILQYIVWANKVTVKYLSKNYLKNRSYESDEDISQFVTSWGMRAVFIRNPQVHCSESRVSLSKHSSLRYNIPERVDKILWNFPMKNFTKIFFAGFELLHTNRRKGTSFESSAGIFVPYRADILKRGLDRPL